MCVQHDQSGRTARDMAQDRDRTEMVKLLVIFLERATTLNCEIKINEQEFRNAARRGDIEKMKQLLNSGVNIDATDQFGMTALMYTSSVGTIEAVDFLIKNGANVCAKHQLGGTARDMARGYDRTEVVKRLERPNNCEEHS